MKRFRQLGVETLEQRRLLVATVSVSIQSPIAVPESASERIVYTITRDETDEPLAIKFELSGDAVFGVDYTARGQDTDTVWLPATADQNGVAIGTATFYPGDATINLIVTPRVDSIAEGHESIVMSVVQADEFGPAAGAAAQAGQALA